jgi:hypothetical protein
VGVVAGGTEQFRFGSNPIPGGNKNLLINGSMKVAQRGASFTGITSSQYTLDQWYWLDSGTTSMAVTITQDTDVPTVAEAGVNFENSLKIDVTTAESLGTDEQVSLRQKIEAQNVTFLGHGSAGALDCTLSFWVKSTKTGIFCVFVQRPDGSRNYTVEVTIDTTNTWEKKSMVIAGDTSGTAIADDTGEGLNIVFAMAYGSDNDSATADVWESDSASTRVTSNQVNLMDSTSNNVLFTGVQFEVGSIPTSFQQSLISDELARCERYFQRYKSSAANRRFAQGHNSSTTVAYLVMHLRTSMRVAPTTSVNDATDFTVQSGATSRTTTALAAAGVPSQDQVLLQATVGVAFIAGQGCNVVSASGNSLIDHSAEL